MFNVDPQRLDQFAAQVGRAESHADRAHDFLLDEGHIDGYGQGLLGMLDASISAVFEAVNAELSQLSMLCGKAGGALHHAARYYQATDHSAAEHFDAAYEPMYDRAAHVAQPCPTGEGP